MIILRELAPARPRLAVIGTGISGLVAAHRLRRDYDLTIFEAADYVGGYTHTVDVRLDGVPYAVDTGFIVFNTLNYPGFCALLDELDVPSHETTMSFSVRCDRTGLEYNGTSLKHLFAQRRNLVRPSFYRMIRDILRFNREAGSVPADDDHTTVGAFVRERRYGPEFLEHYLLPMGAAIWSCPLETFATFPVRFVVDFFRNHRMLQVEGRPVWRVVTGGSRQYVDALVRPFRGAIRLQTPVRRLRRIEGAVEVTTARGTTERFDHAIVACHADQALRMLAAPTATETELLGAFPYQRNLAVLHTDESLLPRRPLARAAWNYHLRADDRSGAAVTYDMNRLQGLNAPRTFCVTLNEEDLIDPRTIIDAFEYDHPQYVPGRIAAQRRHDELIDHGGLSYCGAYWGYGFHEDGLQSGLRVARALARVGVA